MAAARFDPDTANPVGDARDFRRVANGEPGENADHSLRQLDGH